jgi:16S rRNA (adenine1518-N6/adenine1519-N6)-dimethyltransferase
VVAGRVRFGQNFLADTSLLEAIVRDSGVGEGDVVLEVGAGSGVLSERLADRARHLHAVEIDRRLEPELAAISARHNVSLHWGDAMDLELAELAPAPTMMVANLPYSIATPLLLRTITDLDLLESWTVMVQREIADRLRAEPGTRAYGGPSVLVQGSCVVRMLRAVPPEVFVPRPRVGSAVISLRRTGPALSEPARSLVRAGFAHRRKSLARSLELAEPGRIEAVRSALEELGHSPDARAEQLTPGQFTRLAELLG